MTDEVRVDTKQCHPPHVRFNTRTTYYNAFFLFRTAIAINGQPAQLGCSVGTAELTLNCRYPSTSVTMNSVFTEFTPILKKYGAYDVSNFWCDSGVPLFGVSFSSQHGLKKFLRSSETVNKGLACALFKMFNEQHSADRQKQGLKRASSEVFHKIEPDVNQQTLPEAEERKSPRPVAVNTVQAAQLESPATSPFHVLPVVLNSEVFQISPDPVKSQARLVEVTLDNYATCMNTWKESEVFDFASLFREHQTDQNAQGEVTLKDLTNELTEVVDWFHMGGNLEVPPHELKKIKYDCKNADDCMIQMLMVRMQLKKMTWSDIIRALVGIKMRSLAHKIAVKYGVALPLPSIGPSVPLATEGGSLEQKRLSRRVEQLQNDLEDKDRELERKQQVLQSAQMEKTYVRQRVAHIKQTLLTTHAKTTKLLKAKNEFELELKSKKLELMFLEALHNEKEQLTKEKEQLTKEKEQLTKEKEQLTNENLKFIIQNKEAEIKRLQDQVQDLDGQLKSEKKEAIQLREELSQATKDLEGKSVQIRELERTRSELRSDLENERKRVDMLLMQTTAATTSKEDHIKEIEHQVTALRNGSETMTLQIEAYRKELRDKDREINKLEVQLQEAEGKLRGLVHEEAEITQLQSIQSLLLEQQLHRLTTETSDLSLKLVQTRDEMAEAVINLEKAQNSQEFQQSSVVENMPVNDTALDMDDDLFDVMTELTPVAARWRHLGTGLRLKSGELDTIALKRHGNPQDCLTDVVTEWLRRNYNTKRYGEPTWRKLVEVVAHKAAGNNIALAREIAERHAAMLYSPTSADRQLKGTASAIAVPKDNIPKTEQTRRETEAAKVKSPTGPKHDSSALFEASERGDVGTLRRLLAAGVSTELQEEDGITALMYACFNGHEEAVKILLTAKANIDRQDNRGITALHCASQNGHCDTVRVLLDAGANTELQNETSDTALIIACGEGHKDITVLLLSAKANIDHQTKDGWTALLCACQKGNSDIAALLVSAKANIDHQNKDGATALYIACQCGHRETVQVLLDSGANTELQRQTGNTALIIACEEGHKDITVLLLSAKANIDHQNKEGFTALHYACLNGHTSVVSVLLDHDADLHLTTKNGFTALHYACQLGHPSVVSVLLEHGADLHLTTKQSVGATPLMLACLKGHIDVVHRLIEAKADVNQLSRTQRWTALMEAAMNGHVGTVKKLIASGAKIDMKNDAGNTALDLARQKGHTEVCQVLLARGH